MKYYSGYKYQLAADEVYATELRPASRVQTPFIVLTLQGELTIKKGYAWDGASGMIINDDVSRCFSLPHDALYQLMRNMKLNPADWEKADRELERVAIARLKISNWRTRTIWKFGLPIAMRVLKKMNGKYAQPNQIKEIKIA